MNIVHIICVVACLFGASAGAQGGELYLRGDLAGQLRHGPCTTLGPVREQAPMCYYDRNMQAPALGYIELGMRATLGGRWRAGAYASHESVIGKRDYGVNKVGAYVEATLLRWGR